MTEYVPSLKAVKQAAQRLEEVVLKTPLIKNERYSRLYQSNIYLKREDLQQVRSYKIRGAYNKISSLDHEQKRKGIVCASAGNHAQGVALSCKLLGIHGTIYMPSTTPQQKIEQVRMFGEDFITVVLKGDTFDDASDAALKFCEKENSIYIPPFDDIKVIEGQGTIGIEIYEQLKSPIDYIFVPIGGGGLAAGISSVFSALSPSTQIIGVEPAGAASMQKAFEKGGPTRLEHIEKFVDGAAVQKVGELNYKICKKFLADIVLVPEGKDCQTILDLYNKDAIVVEPAGALSVAALDFYKEKIKGKNVVCVISGSNNDIARTAEITERALLHANLKHYFIVRFPQRAGALKEFVSQVLGPSDDITYFEYSKKTSKENGPAVVGILLKNSEDLEPLVQRMKRRGFFGEYLNDKPDLFQYLI